MLADLLAAADVPRVRLTRIFRQAQTSGVVTNAHRINAGRPPATRGLADFFLFAEDDPQRVAELTVDIVANRLPRRFGCAGRQEDIGSYGHRFVWLESTDKLSFNVVPGHRPKGSLVRTDPRHRR